MTPQEKLEPELKRICTSILSTYQKEIDNFLTSQPSGSLSDADVIIMHMNLITNIATNIYYKLKDILPTTPVDFDYMKASIINSLKDSFEKVKEYKPQEKYMPLTVAQIKEVFEKGFSMITMPDGEEKKITKSDILIKSDELKKLLDDTKKEVKDAASAPKIIKPGDKIFQKPR